MTAEFWEFVKETHAKFQFSQSNGMFYAKQLTLSLSNNYYKSSYSFLQIYFVYFNESVFQVFTELL